VILEIIGDRAFNSMWLLSGVDSTGDEKVEDLYRVADEHVYVTGRALHVIAQGVWQIIDGKFEAFDCGEERPWLVVYAVDSSAYDVITSDEGALEKVKARFHNVSPYPDECV
jgi:hypothetical protein